MTRSRNQHIEIEGNGTERTVRCSTGRTFTQRWVVYPKKPGWLSSTASWVGVCPGCHAARIARYRAKKRLSGGLEVAVATS